MCWSLRRFGNLLTAEATKCSFFIVRMLFKSAVNFPVSWPFFGARPDNPTSCDGDNEDEFPFKAFRISGQTVNERIVFTVTAKVCYDGFPGCECNCGDRKRRSTLDETPKSLILH